LRVRLLAAVLAPMLAIGGTAIIASQALEGRFHALDRQALEAELVSGIATDFAEMRRLAREHAFTGDWAYFSATKSYTKSLQIQIDEGLILVQDPERRAELREIGARISAYLGHVKALGKLKEEQQALVEGVLDPAGAKLGDTLQGLAAAVEDGDAATRKTVTAALRQFLELRSLADEALGRSDAAAEEAAERAFASFTSTLGTLDQAGMAAPLQAGVAEVGQLALRYREAFQQAATLARAIRDRDDEAGAVPRHRSRPGWRMSAPASRSTGIPCAERSRRSPDGSTSSSWR
jgi:hypothetical protein